MKALRKILLPLSGTALLICAAFFTASGDGNGVSENVDSPLATASRSPRILRSFQPAPTVASAPELPAEPETLRREARAVDDVPALRWLETGAIPQPGDVVRVEFFDDVAFDFHIATADLENVCGGETLVMRASTAPGAPLTASFVVAEGKVVAVADDVGNARAYLLAWDFSQGAYFAKETDKTRAGRGCGLCGARGEAGTPAPEALAAPVGNDDEADAPVALAAATGTTTYEFDYLAAFDTTGAAYARSHGGLTGFAQTIVASMNNVFDNSNISARYNLVGAEEIDYTAGNSLSNSLYRYAGHYGYPDDDTLAKLRIKYIADFVQLFVNPSDPDCGGLAHSDTPFSVVVARWAGANSLYNSAHECGHNLGCLHARGQTTQPGEHTYAVGAYSQTYASVMAYKSEAPDGRKRTLAPIFSSPTSVWNGETLGSYTENNRRMVLESAPAAEKWMEPLSITLSKTAISLAAADDASATVTVSASGRWTARSSASWLEISPSSGGSSASVTSTISAREANPFPEARTAQIRFFASNDATRVVRTITVRQSASATTSPVTPQLRKIRFAASGGSVGIPLTIKSGYSPAATANEDLPAWLNETYSQRTLTFTASENAGTESRAAEELLVGAFLEGTQVSGSSVGIRVEQAGTGPDVVGAAAAENDSLSGSLDEDWLYVLEIPNTTGSSLIRVPKDELTGEIFVTDEDWITEAYCGASGTIGMNSIGVRHLENENHECREAFLFFQRTDGSLGAVFIRQAEK